MKFKLIKFLLVLMFAVSQQSFGEDLDRDGDKLIEEIRPVEEKYKEDVKPFVDACLGENNVRGKIKAFDDFKDNGDGTLTDPRNGLVWQKCALGQTWDGNTCAGKAESMNWYSAMLAAKNNKFAGMSDWRLPTQSEFKSVMRDKENECIKQAGYFRSRAEKFYWDLKRLHENHFGSREDDIFKQILAIRKDNEALYEKLRSEINISENVSEKLAYRANNDGLGRYWSISPEGDAGYLPISNGGGQSSLAWFSEGMFVGSGRIGDGQARLVRAGQVTNEEAMLFQRELQRADKGMAELKEINKVNDAYEACLESDVPKRNEASQAIEVALALKRNAQQEIQRQRDGAKYSGYVDKQVMLEMGRRIAAVDSQLPGLFNRYKQLGGTAKTIEGVRGIPSDPCRSVLK